MRLEHHQASEPPEPVNVSDSLCRFLGHRSLRSVAIHYRACPVYASYPYGQRSVCGPQS